MDLDLLLCSHWQTWLFELSSWFLCKVFIMISIFFFFIARFIYTTILVGFSVYLIACTGQIAAETCSTCFLYTVSSMLIFYGNSKERLWKLGNFYLHFLFAVDGVDLCSINMDSFSNHMPLQQTQPLRHIIIRNDAYE